MPHDKLKAFLETNVEGYLFADINALRELQPLGQKAGGASYSLLLTVFAGIELLGTLVSVNKFNRYEGSD